jgi:uncharacterized membrane protein
MDNNFDVPLDEATQSYSDRGIHVSNDIRIHLREFSLWTLVLAIIGMVSLGQSLLLSFVKKDVGDSAFSTLLGFLFSALTIWLYYRMHQTAKTLSASNEISDMDAAATAIKNFYLFLGIIMIIVLVIILGAFLFVTIAGANTFNS